MNTRFIRNIAIKADEQGNLPKTLDLLHEGSWNTPWHGDFETTRSDILEYVEHFNQKIGLPEDNDGEAPVNYSHKGADKAGGWLSNPRAEELDDGKLHLVADVSWTPAGTQAIKDKEFKYISPEFNPRALPWEDPEQEWHFVSNVLTGAGLTNIPLFKKLKKVAASERPDSSNNNQGEDHMDLAALRAKNKEDLEEAELTFLGEHKAELSTEELAKFEFTTEDSGEGTGEGEDQGEGEGDPKPNVQGSAKTVSISASELSALKASAKRADELAAKIDRQEAETVVDRAINAGQIKSGDRENWTNQILASQGTARKGLETLLASLPKNEQLSVEAGSSEEGSGQTATAQAFAKASEMVKADSKLSHRDALLQVLKADSDLAKRFNEEGGKK